jgi:hypothetical protein
MIPNNEKFHKNVIEIARLGGLVVEYLIIEKTNKNY